ncbi:glycosyltransferase family 4 protein [Pedobacter cryoconitis]|uniref:Glycosyltransferase involved in cell wall biosynthesis n=1 Tax=Pedobacter cryoconitis TaxID=188932 RepID=A0A327T1A2_9SPHI|nr:glycosyltransferase family 4 protein [Pedobacter cryoconitis]RAJ35420.1 glycosyltransferase involved in cell wall biosynthesis [Pedobacter cryoconitis]
MKRIKIMEAGNQLGLRGAGYTIRLISKFLNKESFEVTVVGVKEGGEGVELIRESGVNVILLNADLNKFTKLLQETDVFHWHGDGSLDPELFAIVKANKPKLVLMTNNAGMAEHSSYYKLIDYDLFISKMILVRRMLADRDLEDDFTSKRKVLSNPVDISQINSLLPAPHQVKAFKQQNNLQNSFIVGRAGRSDNAKFDLVTLDGFAEFAKKVNHAKFLLVGATAEILEYAKSLGIMDKLIVFDTTSDLQQLLLYYRSMDVFLAASKVGENFGKSIAEAMAVGLPVITVNTLNQDNVQIELVDNGQTGFVVSRDPKNIADVLFFLYEDEKIREILSESAKRKAAKQYKAEKIVKSLENLIYSHLYSTIELSEQSLVKPCTQEIINDYINRCSDLWEPEIKRYAL